MTRATQLSGADIMFVAGETETIYQHVAGLVVIDTSDCPQFNFDHFYRHCTERLSLIPHFRWKLHDVPMGLDRPYWVEDENFSFERHIRRIALPSPGDEATLCDIAAYLYSRHLERSRPLWEIWFIEGLEGGKSAFLQKFHHCMMDGEGAFKMMEVLCDFEPEPGTPKVVDKSIARARAGKPPTVTESSSNAWRHYSRIPGDAARGMYDLIRPKVIEQLVRPRPTPVERPTVPTVCFNGAVTTDRAISVASLPLADLKAVKNHFGVTLNDVLLAVVSSAIRGYLEEMGELPALSLRTSIPVSLRTEQDAQLSNKVTNTTVTLATDVADPAARMRAIHEDSERAKREVRDGAMGMLEVFQKLPPILVSSLMNTLREDQAPQVYGANLIVSNVRGSPIPMYVAGARMESMYPLSILTVGMGINFTCVSYADNLDVALMVEPNLVPDYQSIADGLKAAVGEYLELCRPPRVRRKSARAKVAKGAGSKAKKPKAKTKTRAKTKSKAHS